MAGTSLTSRGLIFLMARFCLSLEASPYGVIHREAVSGKYKVTSAEKASYICRSYGQHLATPAQLLAAQQKGYGQCLCGWLSDGSARYPVNKLHEGCTPNTEDGVVKCPQQPAPDNTTGWDVYCSTNKASVVQRLSAAGIYRVKNLEEAKAVCTLHGENVATQTQLLAAQEQGYHVGYCGWLAEGTVKYPKTYDIENGKRLETCPSDPSVWNKQGYNVFCSTVPASKPDGPTSTGQKVVLPSYAIAVIAVLAVLLLLTTITVIAIFLMRRRRRGNQNNLKEGGPNIQKQSHSPAGPDLTDLPALPTRVPRAPSSADSYTDGYSVISREQNTPNSQNHEYQELQLNP